MSKSMKSTRLLITLSFVEICCPSHPSFHMTDEGHVHELIMHMSCLVAEVLAQPSGIAISVVHCRRLAGLSTYIRV